MALLIFILLPYLNSDSVQAFKKRMKLGRFADKDPTAEAEAAAKLEEERVATEAIVIGTRCEVTGGGGMAKRGVVMFTGEGNRMTYIYRCIFSNVLILVYIWF